MICDVCGHEMRQLPDSASRWSEKVFTCPWCHAFTTVGGEYFAVCRPPYQPVFGRWERAMSDLLPEDVHHAYGGQRQTLCGIEDPDLWCSPWPWVPSWPSACARCLAAAQLIDARWPEDRRGLNWRGSIYATREERDGLSDAFDDELGRPDVRLSLPEDDAHARVRVVGSDEAVLGLSGARSDAAPTGAGFCASWLGTDLGVYRPCHSTYERYPVESLPPLDETSFVGDFAWFGEVGDTLDHRVTVTDRLTEQLSEAGLSLPADFITLMTRSNLHRALDRVSCTGCWTGVSKPLPSPVEPGARMVRFFSDSQGVATWYLYLRENGESCVVHSSRDFEHEPELCFDPEGNETYPDDEIFWSAPSVEVFAYRFWVENTLWHAISERRRAGDLSAEQCAYLAHYLR